jgi:WD40 repeat protein
MRLWDVAEGKELRRFEGHTGGVWAVAFSPDGRHALSGGGGVYRGNDWVWDADPTMRLWDLQTGREVRRFEGHTGQVLGVAFASDGRHAVSGGTDLVLRVWEVKTGRELRRLEGHTALVLSVTGSPDGRHVLSTSRDGSVRLWDVESGKEVRRFEGHNGWVMAAVLSPDGRRVLSGGADHTVRLWDTASGKELRRFAGHTTMVLRVAFSPDGRWALSGGGCQVVDPRRYAPAGKDYGVRLWDVESGEELLHLEEHRGAIFGLAFAPDGRRALSGSGDTTLRVWGLPR